MTTFTTIDLNWTGRPRSIAALVMQWEDTSVLIDPGPESTLETLRAGLRDRGQDFRTLDAILLTHIHLDHAGATRVLVRENHNVKVYVHEFGLVHMIDPTRLLATAGRRYRRDLQTLNAACTPMPETNLQQPQGGERIPVRSAGLQVCSS